MIITENKTGYIIKKSSLFDVQKLVGVSQGIP